MLVSIMKSHLCRQSSPLLKLLSLKSPRGGLCKDSELPSEALQTILEKRIVAMAATGCYGDNRNSTGSC